MKSIFALLILGPIFAFADHRPEFQAAINQPANMLDIAMLRIQDFIVWTKPFMAGEYHDAAETEELGHIDINAEYRADDGVILVSATLTDRESTRAQMKAGCERVLYMMRINMSKGLHRLFSHIDGSFTPVVEGQPANLSSMIKLSCSVAGGGSSGHHFRAELPLELDAEMEIL